MTQTREFHQLVVAYLSQRVKGGTEPSTTERSHGDCMDRLDFDEQLSSACGKGLTVAVSAVHRWATTGKVPRLSGVAGFVLSSALAVAQRRLGAVNPPGKIAAALSGPPWSEGIAAEIVDTIFHATAQRALDRWIEQEAGYAYLEWEKGYREYYEGPEH